MSFHPSPVSLSLYPLLFSFSLYLSVFVSVFLSLDPDLHFSMLPLSTRISLFPSFKSLSLSLLLFLYPYPNPSLTPHCASCSHFTHTFLCIPIILPILSCLSFSALYPFHSYFSQICLSLFFSLYLCLNPLLSVHLSFPLHLYPSIHLSLFGSPRGISSSQLLDTGVAALSLASHFTSRSLVILTPLIACTGRGENCCRCPELSSACSQPFKTLSVQHGIQSKISNKYVHPRL